MKFSQVILILLTIVFIAGCTSSGGGVYKNEVLLQSNYVLTRTNPFTDSTTSIRFYLKNFGRDTIPHAIVDFFDLGGLTVNSLTCNGGSQINDHSCEFSDIQSLDSRYISITVNTPSSDIIKSPTNFQIKYKISFDYSGFRRLIIPIIDDTQESQPQNKFTISDPSVGPIAVDFEPPVGAETKQGDQVIKEYWGVKGDTFDVRMNFKQAIQTNVVTNITGNNIKLQLQGLTIDSKSKCDFTSGLTAKSTVSAGQTQVPLSCSFRALSFNKAETMSVIDVSFSYTFDTIKTETISVIPRQIEGGNNTGEGGTSGGGSSGVNPGV